MTSLLSKACVGEVVWESTRESIVSRTANSAKSLARPATAFQNGSTQPGRILNLRGSDVIPTPIRPPEALGRPSLSPDPPSGARVPARRSRRPRLPPETERRLRHPPDVPRGRARQTRACRRRVCLAPHDQKPRVLFALLRAVDQKPLPGGSAPVLSCTNAGRFRRCLSGG